jgi:hypothetical protein
MMKYSLKYIGLLLTLLFSFACEKEELPVEAYHRGDVTIGTIDMGSDYKYQIFYNIDRNRIVSKSLKTTWDLAFKTGASAFHIKLNSSKAMQVVNTRSLNFETVTAIPDSGWKWDVASENVDSLGIGSWLSENNVSGTSKREVYVLDLGYNSNGMHLGHKKLQLLTVDYVEYTFQYANLDGSEGYEFKIEKDSDYNFVYFSFDNGGKEVLVAPRKTEWNFVFTQYTHTFAEDGVKSMYLVTGMLQNKFTIQSKKDTVRGFDKLTYDDAVTLELDSASDVIGYDWKEYNYDNETYKIFSNINYVIKNREGFYYKLHFIDFYNQTGEKGTPTFEYKKI